MLSETCQETFENIRNRYKEPLPGVFSREAADHLFVDKCQTCRNYWKSKVLIRWGRKGLERIFGVE